MKRTSNIRESQTEKEQGNDYIIIDFDKHPKERTGRIVFSKEIHLSQRNTTETEQKQELIKKNGPNRKTIGCRSNCFCQTGREADDDSGGF